TKLLHIIDMGGLTHPIDTIMMFAMRGQYDSFFGSRFTSLATLPILVISPLAEMDNKVDSDIQRDFVSLPYNYPVKVSPEINNPFLTQLSCEKPLPAGPFDAPDSTNTLSIVPKTE